MEFPESAQAMMFLAGANSIFTGDTLLTTANPAFERDAHMFEVLGLEGKPAHVQPAEEPCAPLPEIVYDPLEAPSRFPRIEQVRGGA